MKNFLIVTSLILMFTIPVKAHQVKILPLDIYSPTINRSQAQNILEEITKQLKKYKKFRVMTPPNQNPLDMILDAGFMDLNAKSLSGLGRARGADIVLYTAIKKEDGRYYLYLQKVDVGSQQQVVAKGGIGALDNPDKGIVIAMEQVFGPVPKPLPKVTVVSVITRPPDAEVYMGGQFLDRTPLVTKLKPGKYILKITKPGYRTQSRTIDVKKGKPIEVGIRLNQILIPRSNVPPGQQRKRVEKERHWYQTWWFWTTVGVVVAAGVTTGAILGTRSKPGPTGTARFIMDPNGAYQDVSVQGK